MAKYNKKNKKEEKGNKELKELEEEIKEEIEDNKQDDKKTSRLIFIIPITLVLLFISFLIVIFTFTPTIKLIGDKEIKLMINSDYTDQLASAKYLNKDVSSDIKISGKVNTKKKGKYTITYSIRKGIQKKMVKRVVKVVTNGPIITLEGNQDYSICPDEAYEEVGFKALDSKENDLTKKVVTSNGQDMVTYTVKDSNNIIFSITRKLIREDKDAPEIKLNGNSHVYVTLGNIYTDGGATASDKCDGDLTEKIETTGTVDTNTLGDYEITYKVSDKAGNTTEVKRTVTVQKQVVKRSASLGCGKPGVIYLTFDDGPNGATTPSILNTLKKHGVKATFFVTLNGPEELIKREYDEGHLIALHTASHDYAKVYASDDAYWDDLTKVSDRVEKIIGKKSMLVRFPGGSSNTVSRKYSSGVVSRMVNKLEANGYSYFDWNLDSRDAEGKNKDEVYSNVVNGLSKSHGNVILMHDIKYPTMNAIDRIIQYGKDNGYEFDVLDSSVICHHKVAN